MAARGVVYRPVPFWDPPATMIVGLNDHPLYFEGSSTANPGLIAGCGAQFVRIPISWAGLETASGVYSSSYLSEISAVRTRYKAAGLKVLWTVVDTPDWASSAVSNKQNAAPTSPTDYASIMAYLVAQFPGDYWDTWNEPDGNVFLVPDGVPVTGSYDTIMSTLAGIYVPMCQSAFPAMKAADPTCSVVAFALGSNPLNPTFYDACVALGILGNYDIASAHTYGNPGGPIDPDPTTYFSPLLTTFQAARATAGDTKPLWVTEFGWTSDQTLGSATQEQQASWATAYLTGLANRGDIPVAMVYDMQDSASSGNDFGVTDYFNSPKSAYTAIQAWTS